MLIYNYQKEFLGIEEKDLKTLGFATLADLKAEVNDFADLFVKTPGYVHNFKHVHWIDFIAYADEGEEAKVLINVNAKTFTAKLGLTQAYLADNPSAPAYMIHLHGLRSLSNDETQKLSSGILERELPEVTLQKPTTIIPSSPTVETVSTPAPSKTELNIEQTATVTPTNYENLLHDEPLETPPTQIQEDPGALSIDIDESLFQDDDDMFDETPVEQEVISPEVEKKPAAPQTSAATEAAQKLADSGFIYDPSIASRELGLPLDLIEEFIQDFILQAKEFQPKIYASLEEGDIENVKILAHKLKGVAANLRVEDAHEVLSSVSATSDAGVIRENIDAFYIIMQRLSGEEAPTAETVVEESTIEIPQQENIEHHDDDKIEISFDDDDDDVVEVADDEVPLQIDIPELADDDFYQQDLLLKEDEAEIEAPQKEFESLEIKDIEEEMPKVTYSKKEVAAQIGLSLEDFNELFADFEKESLDILAKMKEATQSQDLESVKNEALKLKGMSDNMRLTSFTEELTKIVHTTDQNEILNSINLLEKELIQISAMGA